MQRSKCRENDPTADRTENFLIPIAVHHQVFQPYIIWLQIANADRTDIHGKCVGVSGGSFQWKTNAQICFKHFQDMIFFAIRLRRHVHAHIIFDMRNNCGEKIFGSNGRPVDLTGFFQLFSFFFGNIQLFQFTAERNVTARVIVIIAFVFFGGCQPVFPAERIPAIADKLLGIFEPHHNIHRVAIVTELVFLYNSAAFDGQIEFQRCFRVVFVQNNFLAVGEIGLQKQIIQLHILTVFVHQRKRQPVATKRRFGDIGLNQVNVATVIVVMFFQFPRYQMPAAAIAQRSFH